MDHGTSTTKMGQDATARLAWLTREEIDAERAALAREIAEAEGCDLRIAERIAQVQILGLLLAAEEDDEEAAAAGSPAARLSCLYRDYRRRWAAQRRPGVPLSYENFVAIIEGADEILRAGYQRAMPQAIASLLRLLAL